MPLHAFQVDMHLHTCLSPCSDWAMSPSGIVSASRRAGLDLIAVCDHNSAENAGAVMRAGASLGLTVLPGMEVCSREEVHLLAVFAQLPQALAMQAIVYDHLPGENNTDLFGYQVVADEHDEVIGENPRLLIGATDLKIDQIVRHAHDLGGICIASHVDRPAYSLLGHLGFIPDDLQIDGFEVSYRIPIEVACRTIAGLAAGSCITASDAHYPQDIGRARTVFILEAPTLEEIRMALQGRNGRRIDH